MFKSDDLSKSNLLKPRVCACAPCLCYKDGAPLPAWSTAAAPAAALLAPGRERSLVLQKPLVAFWRSRVFHAAEDDSGPAN